MDQTWILAVVVLCVVALVIAVGKNARQYPYEKAGPVLSHGEARFYFAMLDAIEPDQLLLTKIRVADLIRVKPGLGRGDKSSGFWKAFAQISQRHADFVVVDRATFQARAVIELDDASHNSRQTKEADAIKDKAFAAAGLPLIRVKAAGWYEPNELSVKLIAALNPPVEKTPNKKTVTAMLQARAAASDKRGKGPSS